jgi:hypothetical protein
VDLGLDRASVALLYDLFLAAARSGAKAAGHQPRQRDLHIVGSYDVGPSPLPAGLSAGRGPGRRAHAASSWPRTPAAQSRSAADRDEEIVRHAAGPELECLVLVSSAPTHSRTAHIVLPSAFAEADGTTPIPERRIQLNRKKVEPPAGIRPAWRVYADIAGRRGAAWRYDSAEDVMK